MIEIKDVSLEFGKKRILKKISLELENGVYGILGPNGAGKTTLLRCIAGLYEHYTGEILIHEKNVKPGKARLGYLPQKFSIYQDLRIKDNMQYFAALKGIPKSEREEKIQDCLKAVHMEEYENYKGNQLSGGMLRRIGIAQAMLDNPEILLLDEPTVGLDPEERIHFKEIISGLRDDMVVLMSTHIVEDIEACCRKILVMNSGTICFVGSGDALRELALGKVFEVTRENYAKEEGLYVEKEYEKETGVVKRILTGNECSYEAVRPTIEDGYLCVIKKI